MLKRWVGLALMVCALFAGCGRRVATVAPRAVTVPEHAILFRLAASAFEEATPEGYARSADLLRRATTLAPERCEYPLHLAQALFFLALEQKLNQEESDPNWSEAVAVVDSISPEGQIPFEPTGPFTRLGCESFEPFVFRLRALSAFDEFTPGRDRAARGMIGRAVELDPEDPLNWFVQWRLRSSMQQENPLNRAVSLAPGLALVQHELGTYQMIRGHFEEAKKAFERAIQLSPRHFRSYIGLAQALGAIDEQADVEPLYVKAVELAPTFLEGRILLGDFYSGLEETEKGVEQYQAALAFNPDFEIGYLRMGVTFVQAGKMDEAEKALASAIALNAASYEAYYYLGNIWFARGDFVKAKKQYEESLKYVLNFPEATYALGVVFHREGQSDLALTQYEKVLRVHRQHPDAYLSRGAILAERRKFSDAIADFNRAIAIYDRLIVEQIEETAQAEERGLARKAAATRKKKERLETLMERARQSKMKAEDESFKIR